MAILDKDGNEVKEMPAWHSDVQIMSLMCWQGHWFEYAGIDPDHDPNVIFFRYKGPTAKTKSRRNNG